MTTFLRASLALSTRASYNSASRSFTHFAISRRQPPPCIRGHTDAVRYLSVCDPQAPVDQGLPLWCAESPPRARLSRPPPGSPATPPPILRGINRLEGSQPDARLPITPSLLRSFHKLLLMAHYDHLMLWATGHLRYKPKTPCPALHSRPVT